MKKILLITTLFLLIGQLFGCAAPAQPAQIAATTLPVYEFTAKLCEGTGLGVARLVNESVSCLHDYSLSVDQVRTVESAQLVVISGAGLEDFMADLLLDKSVIDCSSGIALIEGCHDHGHGHSHDDHADHHHDQDPHIWLSPENARTMVRNIHDGLVAQYPQHSDIFSKNLQLLIAELDELERYGKQELSQLSCRELITFHDGFAYLAQSFDLTILEAVEEESGSEASAAELTHLIEVVRHHDLPAIFTEALGSTSAAQLIASETGVQVYTLDMAMHGESYFSAMYHNISTLKGALG